jgi:dTDP-4-dehydrorhamnose reductase
MKILLLGSTGQLGSDILLANKKRYLLDIQVLTRDDLDLSEKKNIKNKLLQLSFDVLINCTSFSNTMLAESNPYMAFAINSQGVKEIAKACKEKNARLVHISTDYVFGDNPNKKFLTELEPPAPVNIYGASKLMGESLVKISLDDYLIFRVASLFGLAGTSGKGGNFVETIIRLGTEERMLNVVFDQIMSPTSTADIADVILKAILQRIPVGTYHAVNTGRSSWYEFAKIIIKKTQLNVTVKPVSALSYDSTIQRPSFSALDNGKLSRLVGPIRFWEEALDDYLIEKGHIASNITL